MDTSGSGAGSANKIFRDGFFVEVDAQSGSVGDVEHAVLGDDALFGDVVPQRRLFLDDEFADERVGDAGQEVERGGDVQVGREAVVDDRQAAVGGEAGDLHGLGEAAAARQVDLHDVDLAAVHQFDERLPVALLLAGRDAQLGGGGELGVALVVVGQQRLLEPEDVVLGKGAGALDGGLGVPDEAGVDHQVGVVAQAFAGSLTSAMSVSSSWPIGSQPNLTAVKPRSAKRRATRVGLVGRGAEERAGVGADLLVKAAAEQLPDRHGRAPCP